MNQFLPDDLLNGFLLCVCIQLILVGFWHIIKRSFYSLGLICIIIGSSWIYNFYFPVLKNHVLANILLAGYKELAIFPLIYIFFSRRFGHKKPYQLYLWHLLVPFIVSTGYLTLKFGFKDLFYSNLMPIVNSIRGMGFIIVCFYAYLIIKCLRRSMPVLKGGIIKRYFFIFTLLFLQRVLGHIEYVLIPILDIETQPYYLLSFRYFWHPLNIATNCIMLLFALSEIQGIGKLVFGNSILNQFDSIQDETSIVAYIEKHLVRQKLFTAMDFDLKKSLSSVRISEKDFRLYVKKEFGLSVNEFINKIKVDEFIKVSNDQKYTKYTIDSLYEIAGFRSKATFYRSFKKYTSITPAEFMKNKLLLN